MRATHRTIPHPCPRAQRCASYKAATISKIFDLDTTVYDATRPVASSITSSTLVLPLLLISPSRVEYLSRTVSALHIKSVCFSARPSDDLRACSLLCRRSGSSYWSPLPSEFRLPLFAPADHFRFVQINYYCFANTDRPAPALRQHHRSNRQC